MLLLLPSAAYSGLLGRSKPSKIEQQLADLESRVLQLQHQATVDKVEIDRLRQKLAELEDRLAREAKERAAAIEKANAPRGLTEESVPKPRSVEVIEVADIEEPLDEPIPEDPPASPEDPRVAAAADAPLSDDEDPNLVADAPPATVRPAPSAPPVQDGPSGLAVPGSPAKINPTAQALYDQGYSLYHQGRYVDAEETFKRFLAAYGATDLGDNAQFWIGQSRLARNELQSALAAYRQTVREHPNGNKVPDALLQAGEVLERLGDADEARATYEDIERRFPDTTASAEAAKRRARLGSG